MRRALPEQRFPSNHSLAFERYYRPDKAGDNAKPNKESLFKHLAKTEVGAIYRSRYDKWKEALEKTPNVLLVDGKLSSRLIVGLGNPTAHEVGFTFNRIYGAPMIHGSTIKGAMRRACASLLGLDGVLNDESSKPELVLPEVLQKAGISKDSPEGQAICALYDVFGSQESAGALTVYDAWWKQGSNPPFVLDTITPHHPDYYMEKQDLPLESDDPIPVRLLAIRRSETFTFAIGMPNPEWKPFVLQVLSAALRSGVGAKVNAGYGRFQLAGVAQAEGPATSAAKGEGVVAEVVGPGVVKVQGRERVCLCEGLPKELSRGTKVKVVLEGRKATYLGPA
jgi:CRISPR-associated protein Cmr6